MILPVVVASKMVPCGGREEGLKFVDVWCSLRRGFPRFFVYAFLYAVLPLFFFGAVRGF